MLEQVGISFCLGIVVAAFLSQLQGSLSPCALQQHLELLGWAGSSSGLGLSVPAVSIEIQRLFHFHQPLLCHPRCQGTELWGGSIPSAPRAASASSSTAGASRAAFGAWASQRVTHSALQHPAGSYSWIVQLAGIGVSSGAQTRVCPTESN